MIELGRVTVPVADVAAHQVDDDELAPVLRIDLPQVGDESRVEVLRHDIRADVLVDPVLIITGAPDRADRRIPDAVAGLVRNPCGMEAGLPCHVNDGVGIDQLHIIVLVLLRQGFGQYLNGLCVAGIGMIEEGIVRVCGRFGLERRGISVIAIDTHVVARQGLADDEDVDAVRCRLELRSKDAILDRHAAALLHHLLEIGKARKCLVSLIIHMREPRRPDGEAAEPDIHKEEQRHRPPRFAGNGKAAIEGEAAAVEDEPREDEDRKRP